MFQLLFNFESMIDSTSSLDAVWDLIGQLQTNTKMYFEILQCQDLEQKLSSYEDQNQFRLIYCLQIIYGLISNYGVKKSARSCLYYNRKNVSKVSAWGQDNKQYNLRSNNKKQEESKDDDKDDLEFDGDTTNNQRRVEGDHWYNPSGGQGGQGDQGGSSDAIGLIDKQMVDADNEKAGGDEIMEESK